MMRLATFESRLVMLANFTAIAMKVLYDFVTGPKTVVNYGCWVIDCWRLDYNHHRIHSSLDYQTPATYAAGCVLPASVTPQPP